ncbi:NAD(P)H-hydrate dehydratase [Crocinitomix algicola]|uniref:NAD(P)H-hydrate dehydratase n=1 Tax=Crocinitomix algicola TaxID=1740263 RepID=UPI0009F60F14|nr:NAD(P)H-hydrate dehydratase [Crocinitomix algicola]
MIPIYSAQDLRSWDHYTIENSSISSIDLMEKAAIGCCKKIIGNISFSTAHVFCGVGNNGGDGLAIARLLELHGVKTLVYIIGDSENSSTDFKTNYRRLPSHIPTVHLDSADHLSIKEGIIIDAIFGTGLNRPVLGKVGALISAINQLNLPIFSIDIPSGLYADNNHDNPLSNCIEAKYTVTIQTMKMPFFYAEYERYFGKVLTVDIQLLDSFSRNPLAYFINQCPYSPPPLSQFAHKGHKGFLTVIGGFEKMAGAAILATKAGFRVGAGYVGAISSISSFTPLITHLPELIYCGDTIDELHPKTNAIAIGPGLGTSKTAEHIIQTVFKKNIPLIIDADAINLIARSPNLLSQIPSNSILTPHLKELERLIGPSNSPEKRLEQQVAFAKKHRIFLLQKGAYSKLACPDGSLFINSTGNSSMASAGMGDVLSGMIGGLLAKGYAPKEATLVGVYAHGLAGDIAVRNSGSIGILASDIIEQIPAALNQL